MRRGTACSGLVGLCLAGAAPATAAADERVVAGPGTRYATPTVTVDQGEGLVLANRDLTAHDVVASDTGPDGDPLFRSPLVAAGQQAEVAGVRFLTTGQYAFFCSIHPSMRGGLTVTAAGTPRARPDRRAPVVTAAVRARRPASLSRGIRLALRADEAATVRLRARVRTGGRVLTGRLAVVQLAPGDLRAVRLALPAAARNVLSRARRATVTVTVHAVDGGGNESTSTVRRVLRR